MKCRGKKAKPGHLGVATAPVQARTDGDLDSDGGGGGGEKRTGLIV